MTTYMFIHKYTHIHTQYGNSMELCFKTEPFIQIWKLLNISKDIPFNTLYLAFNS